MKTADCKILVVEDDPDLLALMTKKLLTEKFQVAKAETGREALDYLQSQRPNLILLDILLPDIDGLTVLSEIAKDPTKKTIPIIIFSNLDDQGSFEQASAIGHYDYLVKAKTELSQVVNKIKEKLNLID